MGRLVIYAPVVSSSQHVVTDLELTNGIAVIPRQQTSGVGRSNNQVSFLSSKYTLTAVFTKSYERLIELLSKTKI